MVVKYLDNRSNHYEIRFAVNLDWTIFALGGNDFVQTKFGNDELFGGVGSDTLLGGLGDDALNGGSGDDQLFGEEGHDRLIGGSGNDMLAGGAGDDSLAGGPGADTLDGGDGDDVFSIGRGDATLFGGTGGDRFDLDASRITDGTTAIIGDFDFAAGDSFVVRNVPGIGTTTIRSFADLAALAATAPAAVALTTTGFTLTNAGETTSVSFNDVDKPGLTKLDLGSDLIDTLFVSDDGSTVLVGTRFDAVIFDVATRTYSHLPDGAVSLYSHQPVDISADGSRVLLGNLLQDESVYVLERDTGEVDAVATMSTYVSSLKLSGDGQYVGYTGYTPSTPSARSEVFVEAVDGGARWSPTAGIANDESFMVDLDRDGSVVLFESRADNLSPHDTHRIDLFLYDRTASQYTNVTQDRFEAIAYDSGRVSADGSRAIFLATEHRLNPFDPGPLDLYEYDRKTHSLTDLTPGAASAQQAAISADGRFAVYLSSAAGPDRGDVVLVDLKTGEADNITEGANDRSTFATISGDGSLVAFVSFASNLTGIDLNNAADVFLYEV